MKRCLNSAKTLCVVMVVMAVMIFLYAFPAAAAIGKIASFKGDVVLQSGTSISKVTKINIPINDGDSVTTREGEVSITFNDGAVIKVNPFTSMQLQERQEQRGTWIFKTSQMTRRITCMVGKLWFKSGASPTKNYLQSPTAIAGIRGSDGDFGFDNVNTYLNMYSGDAAVIGNVIRGFFENPGIDAATKNSVYQSLQRAYQQTVQAQAEQKAGLKPVVQAQARIAALQVAQQISQVMKANPDATVAEQAQQAATIITSTLSNVQSDLNKAIDDARKAGITVPVTTTTVPATTTAPAATTTAASTTSTTTTSTTSTTTTISTTTTTSVITTTICPSPPCR